MDISVSMVHTWHHGYKKLQHKVSVLSVEPFSEAKYIITKWFGLKKGL